MAKPMDEALFKKLVSLSEWGVTLELCGRPTTPKAIATCMVREEEAYMPDFIYDEEGNLCELHYDRVY